MSRKEYIDALPEETRNNLEEMKQHNAEALKANAVIKVLNADLKTVMQDIHDADAAKPRPRSNWARPLPKPISRPKKPRSEREVQRS